MICTCPAGSGLTDRRFHVDGGRARALYTGGWSLYSLIRMTHMTENITFLKFRLREVDLIKSNQTKTKADKEQPQHWQLILALLQRGNHTFQWNAFL